MIILNPVKKQVPKSLVFTDIDILYNYLSEGGFEDGALLSEAFQNTPYIWGEDNNRGIVLFDIKEGTFEKLETWYELAGFLLTNQNGKVSEVQICKGTTKFIVDFTPLD